MPQAKYQHLYNSKAWKILRKQVFLRDMYICQVCGKSVADDHTHPHAAVCDHIVKHEGKPDLFYDEKNLQTVGASCHNSTIQALERSGNLRQEIGADGWPIEPGNDIKKIAEIKRAKSGLPS